MKACGLVFFWLLAIRLTAQEQAVIRWESTAHDFGKVVQGKKVEHTFKFVNIGTASLIITNVEVSCGCTTPKGWPRDPIKPGDRGEIVVAFNSTSKYGLQHKMITVVSNAINQEARQLTFTAEVVPVPDP